MLILCVLKQLRLPSKTTKINYRSNHLFVTILLIPTSRKAWKETIAQNYPNVKLQSLKIYFATRNIEYRPTQNDGKRLKILFTSCQRENLKLMNNTDYQTRSAIDKSVQILFPSYKREKSNN